MTMIPFGSREAINDRALPYPKTRKSSTNRSMQMTANALLSRKSLDRRGFIGGSDARIIMGDDDSALLRLWREKRGEAEPEDLATNLIVQLGVVTEPLNRHWFERNTSQARKEVRRRIGRPLNRWPGAALINPERSLVATGDDASAPLKKTRRGYFRL